MILYMVLLVQRTISCSWTTHILKSTIYNDFAIVNTPECYVLTDFWESVLICVKIKHCETKLEQAVKEREVINNHKNHDNDNK